jgi:hypothetical protein
MADPPTETTLSASQYRQLVDFVDEKQHRGMIRFVELPLATGYPERLPDNRRVPRYSARARREADRDSSGIDSLHGEDVG